LRRLYMRRSCLEHEILGRALGARSIRRSKLSTSGLQRVSQGGSLAPGGTEVHPEGWTCAGCVAWLETDSRPNGPCSPERARARSGQPRDSPSPGRGREPGTRRYDSSGQPRLTATVTWKLRQQPQIRWCWRRNACSRRWRIRRFSWRKRLQVGQPESAAVRVACPEADRLYSSGHT
jgi:hypothetical protein